MFASRVIHRGIASLVAASVIASASPALNQSSECKAAGDVNSAFVFIKPHANTKVAQDKVTAEFKRRGIQIRQEGELTGEKIDEDMLIDQHYYAIASKATLLDCAILFETLLLTTKLFAAILTA